MASDTDKAVVRRLFDEAINERRFDVLATDFVLHSALLGEIRGGEDYKQSLLGLLNPCPDFHATVEDLIGAESDSVVTRLTYRGTDTGGFVKGHSGTGKPFEFGARALAGSRWHETSAAARAVGLTMDTRQPCKSYFGPLPSVTRVQILDPTRGG